MPAFAPAAVPPANFRVDQVGSLLRPPSLLAARAAHARAELDDATLRAHEDAAIIDAIAMQERLGLKVVTDGEFRRGLYSDNFTTTALSGVAMDLDQGSWEFKGDARASTLASAPRMVVNGRIAWSGLSRNAADFAFLRAHTGATPKITLPGPAFIHYRAGRADISRDVYPSLDDFWSDLVTAYTAELAALHAVGCRYVQLDETSLAKFADLEIQNKLRQRGDDWQALLHLYAAVLNAVADAAPAGMTIGVHLCRGNNQGRWQATGGYQLVAQTLFRDVRIPLYLLEFDSPRAGGLDILAALPEGKTVVLGLVSTKQAELEDIETLRARVREAAGHAPLDQLAISPQCGFASVEYGNPISHAEQEAKLALCVRLASQVWGDD